MLKNKNKLLLTFILLIFGLHFFSYLFFTKQSFDVQGHRGARGLAPENTISGFRKAIELGVTTLELDIGVTKDRIPIIYHDTAINPNLCLQLDGQSVITDSLGNGPLIKNLTSIEIKEFDCGSLNPDKDQFPEPPRKNVPGEKIPILQELFDLLDEYPEKDIWCNIELKTKPSSQVTLPIREFADAVLNVIEKNGRNYQVNIQSFHWPILEYIRNKKPEIVLAGLMGSSSFKVLNDSTPSPWLNGIHFDHIGGTSLSILKEAENYIDIFSPSWRLINPADTLFLGSSIKEIQHAGFKVIPWTVNRTHIMEKLIEEGVDGIITDYPDSLIYVLNELTKSKI